ncbi:MAG: trimethylamine methyltransferase family protein [Chloroflexota bacterium]
MILANNSSHQSPQFHVLSENQCNEIFLAALECLKRIGVRIQNEEAKSLLANAGADVEDDQVRIPAHIIQDAIACTPRTFTIWGRDNQHEMRIAPDRVHFGPGPSCTYFIDPQTQERRRALRGDAGKTALICDALPNMDYVMGLSMFDDVLPVLSPVYEFAEMLANSTKPLIAWANTPNTLEDIYKMAVAVSGSETRLHRKPIFAYFTTYESPLRLAMGPVANMMWAAKHDVPVICLGGPTVGLESPFSGASALVMHLASTLAALTIVQLTKRGTPMVIGGVPSMMDLRTARPAYGSPEMSLHSAAAVDVARYLGLPFMGTAGASESKSVDAQAGAEAAVQVLMSALSGASLVHDVGFLDCADIGSLTYLILTDELVSMVARIMRGIQVNSETIMLDLLEKVGSDGNFISEPRSAAVCRTEAWVPSILDRNAYNIWQKKGSKNTEQILLEKLNKILSTHLPGPLPESASEQINAILSAAELRESEKL